MSFDFLASKFSFLLGLYNYFLLEFLYIFTLSTVSWTSSSSSPYGGKNAVQIAFMFNFIFKPNKKISQKLIKMLNAWVAILKSLHNNGDENVMQIALIKKIFLFQSL